MGSLRQPGQEALALQKTIADVKRLVQFGGFQSAAQRLGELRLHLEQHLDTEGRLVPLFIQRTGDPGGLAGRLRKEHDGIPERLDAVCDAVTHWDSLPALTALEALEDALDAHFSTEAALLHPALDDLVSDDVDWSALHYRLCHPGPTS